MSKHPADMTAEEFFALPVVMVGIQPLRARTDKLGFSDERGVWWVYVTTTDGAWARMSL